MSISYPIPRSLRRSDYIASAGQTLFGPASFKAYDALDVAVYVATPGPDPAVPPDVFVRQAANTYAVTFVEPLPGAFTITFATGRAAGEIVRVQGERTHERQYDVTRAGALISASLESELDKQTVILQELRRDNTDAGTIARSALARVEIAEDDIDALEAGKVAKIGDTMTGPLYLPAVAPIQPTEATNKAFVDDRIANHTHAPAQITGFGEAVDDRVSALIVGGNHITLTYDDAANQLLINSEGGGLSDTPPVSIDPIGNGNLVIEATTNLLLTFKYRGTDGVVRIFEMPLMEPAVQTGVLDFRKKENAVYLALLEDF
jgi:hypothetical protein